MSLKIGMVSLGCPKNQIDAEIMMSGMQKYGFELCSDAGKCDVIVVNTCGFIEAAKRESIENILDFVKLKEQKKIKAIIVTGCLAQRYAKELAKEIPEVDAFVGLGGNKNICEIINRVINGKRYVFCGESKDLPLGGDRVLSTPKFYAYLRIAEGCDNRCSYCAIPMIRGPFRSRKMEDILEEAKLLALQGVKELNIVAQDTTNYGRDLYSRLALPELLTKLCDIEGIEWIRLLYCYPDKITDELINTIATQPKILPYIDIPLQHASEKILKAMNRKGSRESLTKLIEKIRSKIPDIAIRTTIIVGFPGETEKDIEDLAQFIKDIGFARLGCFAFSAEEGTPAAKLPGQIDEREKLRRCDIIMREQAYIMERHAKAQLNSIKKVLVEGYDQHAKCWFGRSKADAPDIDGKVFFTSPKPLEPGDFVNVKISDYIDCDLYGGAWEDSNEHAK